MLTFRDDDVKAQIADELALQPPFALEAFTDLDADVRQSTARIRASAFVPHTDAIHGFVCEVEGGRLRAGQGDQDRLASRLPSLPTNARPHGHPIEDIVSGVRNSLTGLRTPSLSS